MTEELAKKAYYSFAKNETLPIQLWEDLTPETRGQWYAVVQAIAPEKTFLEPSPSRCAWEVKAGVIPGVPMPEHTRLFAVTSFEHESSQGDITWKRMVEALEYARSLHNPTRFNWVHLAWIWY